MAAAALAGCELLPERSGPAPVETRRPAPAPALPAAALKEVMPPPPGSVERLRARWVPAGFGELPGWGTDPLGEFYTALRQGCATPAPGWATLCGQLRNHNPSDNVAARRWLEDRLKVYRVEALDGEANGLLTGYYEPLVVAGRRPTNTRRVPLYAPPADLAARKPWYTRQQADTLPDAQAALKGRELAWLDDPLDALVLQIQGSGRLRITEPDGSERLVRVAYAAHNEQPYKSIGRWLIEQNELKAGEASWPAIRDWARRNPKRLNEMLWQNPRMVFFREEPLPDPTLGPKGAQGVPLTPGRSVAVDPQSIPYGTPMWLDSTEPLSSKPLQRLVMAQDTGSAITGAVRVDFFWGWGAEAEAQAGRMKQALRAWVLWPKG